MRQEKIRNFSIIAHIDHGKSTLADQFLLKTGVIDQREFREQVLDDMDLERERGITIKARSVRMKYNYKGKEYTLNLIDTPGHVDFTYEVSRSLAACEGALLLVDAAQGIEAQTVANTYLALENDLTIIPVVSKIDIARSEAETAVEELSRLLGEEPEQVLLCSGKTGEGVDAVLDAVVERVPPPEGDTGAPLRALVFDAVYDEYRGVILHIRIFDGSVREGDRVRLISSGRTYEAAEVGHFSPRRKSSRELVTGQVGYVICGMKDLHEVRAGDTLTRAGSQVKPLPGYKPFKPMVFCGFYPANESDYEGLKKALERLYLNDPAFIFQPDRSQALGLGFRCGFLGTLHMEIVQERLERESGISIVKTAPNVQFRLKLQDGAETEITNPAEVPDRSVIESWHEPVAKLSIITPPQYIGGVMGLMEERRAEFGHTEYLSPQRVMLDFRIPFMEIAYDFFNRLKSVSRGYATMDYEITGYQQADLVKLDILVHGEPVDALSLIVHRDAAEKRGRALVRKLKKEIPRHLFRIALQAAIGGRIVARENIRPLSKNVTAKCYGGDITRKRKLLERQKEGKQRMKTVGTVRVPQEAFMAVLSADDEN